MRATSINVAFWLVWLLLAVFFYFNSFDDPSSIFFNADKAYVQRYSAVRATEADDFLGRLALQRNTSLPQDSGSGDGGAGSEFLCIGIPSVNRTTEFFLAHTVATLVDTLTPDERASVHIIVLLADRSPETHFAYGQPWLEALADEVLVYDVPSANASEDDGPDPDRRRRDNTPSDGIEVEASRNSTVYHKIPFDVAGVPRGESRVENMRMDHSVLVETCRRRGTPYFALVEDDVVASRDWLPRLRRGLSRVESESGRTGRDWIYLRLFYSELFMGWNSEEWLAYCQSVFFVYAVVLVAFLVLRRRSLPSFLLRRNLGNAAAAGGGSGGGGSTKPRLLADGHLAALLFGLWMPASILLFFMAGRVTLNRMSPFPPPAGVREMPRYGCCAQGLVFPQKQLEGFQRLLRDPPYRFAGDQILEGYAGQHGFSKWALDPSVLQHVGRKESSEGPHKAEVWNFSFERLGGPKRDLKE
ncbi:hypothetical protein VTK73DRAFT_3541 [Phialemonium thermophilum]|uniref:Uncharacterized protein n=1 Tax=Phialemonium thermophilum TaxID=223376 RepID=A0ABR3Y144_9PEZI